MTWRIALVLFTVPGAALGLLLVLRLWRSLALCRQRLERATLAFVAEQDLAIERTGSFSLQVERSRQRGRELPTSVLTSELLVGVDPYDYRLVDPSSGREITGRKTIVSRLFAGWSRIGYEVARFDVAQPGRYRLRVGGAFACEEHPDLRWVFRPVGARRGSTLLALGLIGAFALTLFGLCGTFGVVARELAQHR